MAFIKFSESNSKRVSQDEPIISFNREGRNGISSTAVDQIGISDTDKISIMQDEDNPNDWYMVFDQEDGFTLKSRNNSTGLTFYCAYLSVSLLDTLGLDEASAATFKLSTKSKKIEGYAKAYLIDTSDPKIRTK